MRDVSYLERYVFLRICKDGLNSGRGLVNILVSHKDIIGILKDAEKDLDMDKRNLLLERLSLRGLIYRDHDTRSLYRIASPIIYTYYETFDSVTTQCEDYLAEIKKSLIN